MGLEMETKFDVGEVCYTKNDGVWTEYEVLNIEILVDEKVFIQYELRWDYSAPEEDCYTKEEVEQLEGEK